MAGAIVRPVPPPSQNHYATLGLGRTCSDEQIRTAYRVLAKQHHPDVNQGSAESKARTQELNAAYAVLSDAARRQAHDLELVRAERTRPQARPAPSSTHLAQDVHLGIADFLRGTALQVRITDPAQPDGPEIYELVVPPETAPGTRFRLPRTGLSGRGTVIVRVKLRPEHRFKARGSDLRCDLKISAQRAAQGGMESLRGATGNFLRVAVPHNVARGEIIRVAGEGLPRPRGGRGDLLVRICYRPDVHIRGSSQR